MITNIFTIMKRTLAFGLMALASIGMHAQDEYLELKPTYTGTTDRGCDWFANWFVSGTAGANVFTGVPMGCGDMYDRMMPLYTGSLGKWLDSAWGVRASWSGLQYKDNTFKDRTFHNLHADLMCNLLNSIALDGRGMPSWDFGPYVGLGTMLGESVCSHTLAVSYGIFGRYHIAGALHAVVDLGATRTFGNFDGDGSADRLEDRLLSATAGLSLTIGRKGWRRVISAEPYMAQNEAMRRSMSEMKEQQEKDRRTIEEYRRILTIEGLLKKYEGSLGEVAGELERKGKNDYSGMNSLMARLGGETEGRTDLNSSRDERIWNGYSLMDEKERIADEYVLHEEQDEDNLVSVPVFFFFRLGSSELTDRSQLVNLDEVARIAGEYRLMVNVSGSADSATGTDEINDRLSRERTAYIVSELKKRGMDETMILQHAEGGISRYAQIEANRCSIVSFVTYE